MVSNNYAALRELLLLGNEIELIQDSLAKEIKRLSTTPAFAQLSEDIVNQLMSNTYYQPLCGSAFSTFNSIVNDIQVKFDRAEQLKNDIAYEYEMMQYRPVFLQGLVSAMSCFDGVKYDSNLHDLIKYDEAKGVYKSATNGNGVAAIAANSLYTRRMADKMLDPHYRIKPYLSKVIDVFGKEIESAGKALFAEEEAMSNVFEHDDIVSKMLKDCAKKWDGKDYITGAASYHFSCQNTTYNNKYFFAFLCLSLYKLLNINNKADVVFILECAQGTGKSYLFDMLNEVLLKEFCGIFHAECDLKINNREKLDAIVGGKEEALAFDKCLYTLFSDPFFTQRHKDLFQETFIKNITSTNITINPKYKTITKVPNFSSNVVSWNHETPVAIDASDRRMIMLRGIRPLEDCPNLTVDITNVLNTVKRPFSDACGNFIFYQMFYQACAYVLTHKFSEFYKVTLSNVHEISAAKKKYKEEQSADWKSIFYNKIKTSKLNILKDEITYKELMHLWNETWEELDTEATINFNIHYQKRDEEFKLLFTKVSKEGQATTYKINVEAFNEIIEKYAINNQSNIGFEYNTLEQWKKDVIAYQDKCLNGPTYTDPTPRFLYDAGLIEETHVDIPSQNVDVANSSSSEEDIDALDLIETVEYEEEINAFDLIDSREEVEDEDLYAEAWNLIDYEEEEIIDKQLPDIFEDERVDTKTLTKTRLLNLYDIDKQLYYDLDYEGNQMYHEQPHDVGIDVGNIYENCKSMFEYNFAKLNESMF